ncbi:MAG: hypothetical protein AAGG68_21830 [Bacteroidota bacterium]
MKEKDHIESYFKKHLEHYEESPDEDFWARVAPVIEVPEKDKNHEILWLLLLLFSLLMTGVLMGNIVWGKEVKTQEDENNQPIVQEYSIVDSLGKQSTDLETNFYVEKEKMNSQELAIKLKQTSNAERKSTAVSQITRPAEIEVASEKSGLMNAIVEDKMTPILEQKELALLPSKVAKFYYIAPELPDPPRRLRVQPYTTLHSHQVQSIIYEGARLFGTRTAERTLFNPINKTNLNLGLDAGVIINQQFYLQVGFNQNFGELTYEGTVSKNLSEQEIAIMADGIPINFDFTMDTYFDELEGKLKLTLNTSEIEAGEKNFSVAAQGKVQTTRWMLATAYKIDISDLILLTPKIGINQVTTNYKEYQQVLGMEVRTDANEEMLESQLNVEASRTSTSEEIQLKNVEGILGFQAEIPLGKSRKWLIVPTGELWFDLTPSLKQTNLTLRKSVLSLGVGLRYNIN